MRFAALFASTMASKLHLWWGMAESKKLAALKVNTEYPSGALGPIASHMQIAKVKASVPLPRLHHLVKNPKGSSTPKILSKIVAAIASPVACPSDKKNNKRCA